MNQKNKVRRVPATQEQLRPNEGFVVQSLDNEPYTPPATRSKQRESVVFSIGVLLAVGFLYGLTKYAPSIISPTAQVSPAQSFGLADYESLEPGMTLVEARSILGRGTEVNRSATEASFVWRNSDGSKITAIFSDGKLKSKAQEDLK